MWVSEGRILETDRLATNSMHHQGVHTVAPMFDRVVYGPDGLVEAVEVRDRSFIMGVQWHPEFFAGTREKRGVSFRLACAGSYSLTCFDGRCAWALPSQYQEGSRCKVVADNGICRWYLKDVRIYLGCRYLKEIRSKLTLSIKEIPI